MYLNLRVDVFEFLSSLDSFESSLQAPDDSGDINRPLQSKNDMACMAPFNLNIVPEKTHINFLTTLLHYSHLPQADSYFLTNNLSHYITKSKQ